jgi:hypothetical protein
LGRLVALFVPEQWTSMEKLKTWRLYQVGNDNPYIYICVYIHIYLYIYIYLLRYMCSKMFQAYSICCGAHMRATHGIWHGRISCS